MEYIQSRQPKRHIIYISLLVFGICCVLFSGRQAFAQADQGTITGVVKDSAGAVIPNAQVTLTNVNTGLVLNDKADAQGNYIFSPVKIGDYTVSAKAPGFETTTQENVHLDIQQRLSIPISLKVGAATESVTVTAAPSMLQNDTSSVGQTMSTQTINDTPLNGRNWVYIAQLAAGVAPGLTAGGARGGGTGDFSANGQRTTQNNFILDGIDNNVNVDDFQNGASYNVRPPPDALAEFNIDTADYSAQFGHSAGAVLNAAIKSGTNQIHGDVWEYFRNDWLDAADWDSAGGVVPAYHENQFGATLGGPLWKNHLFYFGDAESNRIAFGYPDPGLTVPTASERNGDFSELFNTNLTGLNTPIGVFAPNTGGQVPLTVAGAFSNPAVGNPAVCASTPQLCAWNPATPGSGVGAPTSNVLSPGDPSTGGMVDIVAKEVMDAYPAPNANGWTSSNYNTPGAGKAYANYNVNVPVHDNTWQWDQRLDWNVNAKDQAYARYSYSHEQTGFGQPLGPILDGNEVAPGGFHGATNFNLAQNFMASETHIFSPNLVNEFRFGYNWGLYEFVQANAHTPADQLIPGMGGVPFTGFAGPNGGLPEMLFTGSLRFATAGARHDVPSVERQNIYQVLDNVTKTWHSHSFKFGVQFESIRTAFAQSVYPRGRYNFNGQYTGKFDLGDTATANTGMGAADAFTDNMGNIGLSPGWKTSYYRNYRAGYIQDDWKVNSRLTANLGLRYDFVQPPSSKGGELANFIINSQSLTTPGSGTGGQSATGFGTYVLPAMVANSAPLSAGFISTLAANHIGIQYTNTNPHSLVGVQHYNFAPRIGFAYQLNSKTVVRSAYGIFYGSIEAPGGAELETNYPFAYQVVLNNNYIAPYGFCLPSVQGGAFNTASQCPSNATADTTYAPYLPYATTLETGGSLYAENGGIGQYAGSSGLAMSDSNIKTPYTQSYHLTIERQLTSNMAATIAYVGNNAKHTYAGTNPLGALAVTSSSNPNGNQNTQAFPNLSLSTGNDQQWVGESMYNGLQVKLERRYSAGLGFLATYTWSHAEDDAANPGIGGGPSYRNTNLIPLKDEFTNANYDTRHRVTVNGQYDLPFGVGRKYLNSYGLRNTVVGGWMTSLTWIAQAGIPFTVTTGGGNFVGAQGFNQLNAIRVGDPFKGGGSVPAANIDMAGKTCPAHVKNRTNWYNPCAFVDPAPGSDIPVGALLTGLDSAIKYSGSKANQIHGPGFERVNMSLFKNVSTWHKQYLQLRADAFNLFNTPTWGQPGITNLSASAGQITSTQTLQNYTPDARFFQISAKYVF